MLTKSYLAGWAAALVLLVLDILCALELQDLRHVEKQLQAVAASLEAAQLSPALQGLAALEQATHMSERQAERARELLERALSLAMKRSFPVAQVGTRNIGSNKGNIIRVALRHQRLVLQLRPAAIRHWIRRVRVGAGSLPMDPARKTLWLKIHLPREAAAAQEVQELPIILDYTFGSRLRGQLRAGSLKLILDPHKPLLRLRQGTRTQIIFKASLAKPLRVTLLPGEPPKITLEDSLGISSVRWTLNGHSQTKSFQSAAPHSYALSLEKALFATSGQNLTLEVVAQNPLGSRILVALRLALRDTSFNPVGRILFNGREAPQNHLVKLGGQRLQITLELLPGEDASRLRLLSGGRFLTLDRSGPNLTAQLTLLSGKPTGLALLNGSRVLKSFQIERAP